LKDTQRMLFLVFLRVLVYFSVRVCTCSIFVPFGINLRIDEFLISVFKVCICLNIDRQKQQADGANSIYQ
jgi:hypothetical protein